MVSFLFLFFWYQKLLCNIDIFACEKRQPVANWMQDNRCLRVSSKFNFGPLAPPAVGKNTGLRFLPSLTANMKSAEEGNQLFSPYFSLLSYSLSYCGLPSCSPYFLSDRLKVVILLSSGRGTRYYRVAGTGFLGFSVLRNAMYFPGNCQCVSYT